MKFPRPTKRHRKCIAIIQTSTVRYPERIGKLLLINTYPYVTYKNEIWKGHRLSFHLNVKRISRKIKKRIGKVFILHHCDNKWCVNPKHLYLGCSFDNARDTFSRHPTVRQNMSKSHMGLKHSLKDLRKMSIAQLKNSAKTSKRLLGNKYRLGIKHSEETKRRLSLAQTKRWRQNPMTKKQRKIRSIAQLKRREFEYKNGIVRKVSKETRRKMSIVRKGNTYALGKRWKRK